jgi:hypothetical protein
MPASVHSGQQRQAFPTKPDLLHGFMQLARFNHSATLLIPAAPAAALSASSPAAAAAAAAAAFCLRASRRLA